MTDYTLSEIFQILTGITLLIAFIVFIAYMYWLAIKTIIENIKEQTFSCIMLSFLLLLFTFLGLASLFATIGI